jgi:hypothetical protein
VLAGDAEDRVVADGMDGAVVQQEGVCERGQTVEGFVVVTGDGLVGAVAGGHDERGFLQQQGVQRRVGEKESELPLAGSDGFR